MNCFLLINKKNAIPMRVQLLRNNEIIDIIGIVKKLICLTLKQKREGDTKGIF